jgi:hypothetical protein
MAMGWAAFERGLLGDRFGLVVCLELERWGVGPKRSAMVVAVTSGAGWSGSRVVE